MDGEEVDARADVLLREREAVLVARGAGALLVHPHDEQVVGVGVARVAGDGLDPVELGDRGVVELDLRHSGRAVLHHLVELAERDRGEHVREVRLVPGHRDVVERPVAAAHDRQVADPLGEPVVVRGDDPALAGGDRLRRVEREAGRLREAADLAAAVLALGGVGGVLDDRYAERPDRVEIGRLPVQVDGHDRLRSRSDELGDAFGVDVQVGVANVREHRRRARVDDHVRRRRPRQRGRDHLVAGPDPEGDQREVHRRRPRGDGQRVLRADVPCEPPLELLGPRTGRQPARPDRVGDGGNLLVPHRGRLESEQGLASRRQLGRHRQ